MSILLLAVDEYLTLRRTLGFKLAHVGHDLQQFVHFAESEGAEWVTTDLALRWATQPAKASPAYWARRLGIVRQFAQYYSTVDPRTEIPPPDLLSGHYVRKPPYLYRDEEITALIEAAACLPSPTGLRAASYATVFGLLAVTGMRIGEPIRLDRADVDLEHGSLSIRGAKFGKSRWLVLHPTTTAKLTRYAERRDSCYPAPSIPSFFLSERGTRLTAWSVRATFVKLSHQIGLRAPEDHHGPRLHDLRHRFAIRTLLHWYRCGANVEQRLPQLAAYLGHAHINDTYWYLSATPELLALAARRLESDHFREVQP